MSISERLTALERAVDERIEQLEVKVAFQEHTIATLDEEVRRAHTRLAAAERKLSELKAEQLAGMEPLEDARPPHY